LPFFQMILGIGEEVVGAGAGVGVVIVVENGSTG
jgi:hypothetical protein